YQDKKGNLRHFMALHFIGCPTKFRVFGPKSTILAVDNRGCCRRWAKAFAGPVCPCERSEAISPAGN
ncbi:MAG: hypothetical protein NTZ17_04710, partial [Phycisphaerae bacterium]|nr:hypothetical protein [Phycisphaerae bacterium]